MAVKTITIDMDAYALLSAEKREGESFSKTIKRRLREPATGARLLEELDALVLGEDALDELEAVLARRADTLAESPDLEIRD